MARIESIQRWILRYVHPYRGALSALALLAAADVALRLLSPWPLKVIVDHVFNRAPVPTAIAAVLDPVRTLLAGTVDGNREQLLVAAVLVGLVLQLTHQLVLISHARLQANAGHSMVRDMRERLFAHTQALTLSHHARTPAGDALYRLEADAAGLEQVVLRGLFPILFSLLTVAAMFLVLIRIDRLLALVALLIVPILFGWLRYYSRRMKPVSDEAHELETTRLQRLHESLAAIHLVKSYGREELEQQRVARATVRALRARQRTTRQETLFTAVANSLTVAGTSLVLLVGGYSVIEGRITLGSLFLLLAYLGFLYTPLANMAQALNGLQGALASAERVRETFALATEPDDDARAVDAALRGEVTFDRVGFRYEEGGRQVLHDVTFTARPGEMLAIVGRSGAGKTTLVSLITRLYEATTGRILIDGIDIRGLQLRALRRGVALVLPEAVTLAGTVRDNLRYGRLDATDAEIEEAARGANCHDFILEMPHGYDTVLGDAGAQLSRGQKQRLSLARAFLKQAPILILDEPTAALDAMSEALVFEGLRRLNQGRTTFVIAHRLSTVRAADRILVLDEGRLVAEGTHDTLLASNALYRDLAAQFVGPNRRSLAAVG